MPRLSRRRFSLLLLSLPLLAAGCINANIGADASLAGGGTVAPADGTPGADAAGDGSVGSPDGSRGDAAAPALDATVVVDAALPDAALPDAALPDAALPDAALPELPPFSFCVTSLTVLQELSGSQAGFGGDLRYGETGPGAGLRGADKLCTEIAERSMPGARAKVWHAFLSASDDGNGMVVHAVDRIGEGPWYDRTGRMLAPGKADLLHDRPLGGDATIVNDLPNEDGIPNHRPDAAHPEVDNHDTLTGTNEQGQLYGADATCLDWTSAEGNRATEGQPRVGHSWPRFGGPGGGHGGPGGDINMANWMSALDEAGCAPGVSIIEMGPPNPNNPTVGSGGGYGGFYCFALTP